MLCLKKPNVHTCSTHFTISAHIVNETNIFIYLFIYYSIISLVARTNQIMNRCLWMQMHSYREFICGTFDYMIPRWIRPIQCSSLTGTTCSRFHFRVILRCCDSIEICRHGHIGRVHHTSAGESSASLTTSWTVEHRPNIFSLHTAKCISGRGIAKPLNFSRHA